MPDLSQLLNKPAPATGARGSNILRGIIRKAPTWDGDTIEVVAQGYTAQASYQVPPANWAPMGALPQLDDSALLLLDDAGDAYLVLYGRAGVEDAGAPPGSIDQGQMHSFLDSSGDFWMVMNATLSGGVWNRIDTSKFAFAMQWIVNGVIPGEEAIDPIGGIVFWRCIPGANPIGPFAAFGGWENVYLFTQYRDVVIGGQAIEIDGAGYFPFGRVIHAPEGTWLGQNAYADLNGRDDATKDSLILGVFGDKIKFRLWPANLPKASTIDLLTLDKSGNLTVAGTSAGAVSGVATYETSLPSSPSDGQQILLQTSAMATANVVWHLRYRSAIADAYKWEYLGGAPLASYNGVSDSIASGTIQITANSPSITLPVGGHYNVEWGAGMRNVAGNWTQTSVCKNGAGIAGLVYPNPTGMPAVNINLSNAERIVAAAAADVIALGFNVSAGTATIGQKWLRLTPTRIG